MIYRYSTSQDGEHWTRRLELYANGSARTWTETMQPLRQVWPFVREEVVGLSEVKTHVYENINIMSVMPLGWLDITPSQED
jgi:hypothetical protein